MAPDTLFVITARGGSKGLPGKNIRQLAGKPLLHYAIDTARAFAPDNSICLSTDDEAIAASAREYGLEVPFMRPPELASDTAGTYEVLQHALAHYRQQGRAYSRVVLLQPTSPLRKPADVQAALARYRPEADMVMSVFETEANPYYLLFEERPDGSLEKSKQLPGLTRRQDAPKVYQANGAVYVINAASLQKYAAFADFPRIIKSEMDALASVDIDTEKDWHYCEFLLEKGYVKL